MKIVLAGLHTYPWLVLEKIIDWDGEIFLKHGERGVQKYYADFIERLKHEDIPSRSSLLTQQKYRGGL